MSVQGDYLKAIADAIRAKEGSTAAIPAKTFASRIRGLPVGIQLSDTTVAAQTTQEGYLKTIADAIHAKEGSTGNIPANTFASRILALKLPDIYGVEWNGTSATKWTRTDGAAGFSDPVPYVAGASRYSSPFDNIEP